MRFPSFPTVIRTLYTLGNSTARRLFPAAGPAPPPRLASATLPLRAGPSIPFLGALFGSSARKTDMEYPVKKSNEEWRAVLSPGKSKSTHLPLQRWWQGSERAASPQLWWW